MRGRSRHKGCGLMMIDIVTLLYKKEEIEHVRFKGFKLNPDDFVVGYGLDCDQDGRNEKGIFVVHAG